MKNYIHEVVRSLVRDFFDLSVSRDSFSELRTIVVSEANKCLESFPDPENCSEEESDEVKERLLIMMNLYEKFRDSDTWATTKPEFSKEFQR